MGVGRRVGVESGPSLRNLTPVLATVTLLAGTSAAAAGEPGVPKHVLVVYPHECDGAPGIVLVNRGIRSTFAAQPTGQIEVRNEYVDTTRLRDAEFMHAQAALLRQKYAGRKVDLVIAGLSSGLDFVLAIRDEVFPGVPVVFVLADEREVAARRLPPGVTGVPVRMDLQGTLDLALRLHPDTVRVFVVAGSSAFDAGWAAEARRAFRPYADRAEFEYLTGLPMDELLARVAGLPEHSIVYYLHIFRDGTGRGFVPADALERLAAAANAPVYTHIDTFVDRGAIGGHVYGHETEGAVAARLGLRVLAGEKPEAIPTAGMSENTYLFDWRQLRRWGIGEHRLPPGSVVRYREPTPWDRYRWHVVGAASVCLAEAVLIGGLLVQRRKRRRAERAAQESEARFRLMADAAPILIWASGVDKACTYFNRPWLEFTGRPLEKEVGDGWADGVYPDDLPRCRKVYATHFDAREPFEMAYRLRRHDGEYRWVYDRGVPRLAPDGTFAGYIGACIDVTDQRQSEEGLRVTQQELKSLTGRLIETQELERRRVARELHDDINQGLALLSVEIDLLGFRPPASPAEFADRVRELSARVRELSLTVHALSHQLHPSKLEQLGLVAAVRGLCKELEQHHGLNVTFASRDVPEAIPEATALCLYRIVQEAMRNVIKHSGAAHAVVELSGESGRVRLRVTDDGAGFDPASAPGRGGLGLVGMRERLHLVGGEVVVDSRPAGGTRIGVRVPLPAPGGVESSWPGQPERG